MVRPKEDREMFPDGNLRWSDGSPHYLVRDRVIGSYIFVALNSGGEEAAVRKASELTTGRTPREIREMSREWGRAVREALAKTLLKETAD